MSANRHPLGRQEVNLEHGSNLPEVVPGTAPECVLPGPEQAPECLYPGPYDTHHKIAGTPSEYDSKNENGSVKKTESRPWWKRKLIMTLLIVAVIIIVGLAVGLGIGLSLKTKSSTNADASNNEGGSNNESGSDNNTTAPSCAGGLCPPILSMAEHESTLYVFARTKSSRLTTLTHDGVSWAKDFKSLGGPAGTMISQPTTISWIVKKKIPRLDVYAISNTDPSGALYIIIFSKAEQWSPWISQGPNAGSPPKFCFLSSYEPYPRLDFWGTLHGEGDSTHTWWYNKPDNETKEGSIEKGLTRENGWPYNSGKEWPLTSPNFPPASSSPGIVCDGDALHDLLWYDKVNGSLLHSSYNGSWGSYQQFGRDFIGDPAVFRWSDSKRWDFFGVQANHELYHLSYTSGDGGVYSSLRSLGGNITSVPSAISVKEGVIDLVALGADGKLQHKHYDGSNWSTDWENLGIVAQSAPSMVIYKENVYITTVAKDGGLISIKRSGTVVASSWKSDLKREDLGGSLSLEFLTYNK